MQLHAGCYRHLGKDANRVVQNADRGINATFQMQCAIDYSYKINPQLLRTVTLFSYFGGITPINAETLLLFYFLFK